MAQKKNWYYVMVMSNSGPVFVTSINYGDKTARWDKLEKPLTMDKYESEDLTLGLNLNFNLAFMVCSKFELDTQPYNYANGGFEWKWDKDKEATA